MTSRSLVNLGYDSLVVTNVVNLGEGDFNCMEGTFAVDVIELYVPLFITVESRSLG